MELQLTASPPLPLLPLTTPLICGTSLALGDGPFCVIELLRVCG